ncbi:MAG: hypothetical protein ACTHOO_04385 [Alcanivorax sp.]
MNLGTAFARCGSHKPHSFISYEVEDTEYIITKNVRGLTAMHGQFGASNVLGLAGGEVGARLVAEFELKHERGDKYCLYVDKVDTVFFAQPKVYIANNFKKDTCEYSQVLKHEEKHVDTLIKAHREYMSKFRSHMRWSVRDLPVLEPMTLDEAHEKRAFFINIISGHITSFIQKINEDVAQRQKKVDSKGEYERVLNNCSRWDEKIQDKR